MKINLNQTIKLVTIVVVLLGAANLIGTNLLATQGNELENLSMQTMNLEKDNLHLKNQISQSTSLAYVEQKANELGFVEINQTLAISGSIPVAYVAE